MPEQANRELGKGSPSPPSHAFGCCCTSILTALPLLLAFLSSSTFAGGAEGGVDNDEEGGGVVEEEGEGLVGDGVEVEGVEGGGGGDAAVGKGLEVVVEVCNVGVDDAAGLGHAEATSPTFPLVEASNLDPAWLGSKLATWIRTFLSFHHGSCVSKLEASTMDPASLSSKLAPWIPEAFLDELGEWSSLRPSTTSSSSSLLGTAGGCTWSSLYIMLLTISPSFQLSISILPPRPY